MHVSFFILVHIHHSILSFLFQSVCEYLWQCLSPSCVELHSEAAVLMSWLNSLFSPSSVCEKVILEHFASQVRVCMCVCACVYNTDCVCVQLHNNDR